MKTDTASRPFPAALEHMDRDGLLHDCDAALEKAVQAVMHAGGKAKLTLVIDIERRGQNQIILAGKIDSKLPKPKAMPVTLFANGSGQLLVNDPDQPEFADVVKLADQPRHVVNVG